MIAWTSALAASTQRLTFALARDSDQRPRRTGPTRGSSTHRQVIFLAPPKDGFDVELEPVGDEPQDAWLVDIRNTLPEPAQRLMKLRGALAVPVHTGDRAATYRRVRI
jgi:hypothetical protein